jgi:hypothetical protein
MIDFALPIETEEINEEFIGDMIGEGLTLINAPRESLDICTHRVIHTLIKFCKQMSFEEIGKLSVMMLNCQLELDGKKTFACKSEMVRKST